MNTKPALITERVSFDETLENVRKLIEKLNSFNITDQIAKLEKNILDIQQTYIDIASYKSNFNSVMEIQAPILPSKYEVDASTLYRIKNETIEYVQLLISLSQYMGLKNNDSHVQVIKSSYALYNQVMSEINSMKKLYQEVTEALKKLGLQYKHSFALDSKEIGYSRSLMPLPTNIKRFEKDIKTKGDHLDEVVINLTTLLEKRCKDMNTLNEMVCSVSNITDYFTLVSKNCLSKHKMLMKVLGFTGSLILALFVVSVLKQSDFVLHTGILFAFLITYSYYKVFKFSMQKKVLISTISELKDVIGNASKKMTD